MSKLKSKKLTGRVVMFAMTASVWLAAAGPSFAAAPATALASAPAGHSSPAAPKKKAVPPKSPAPVKLVDINSASRTELKKLPGIGDAEAERIIAKRPHLSKADIVANASIPAGTYLSIKRLIIAKQKGLPKGKP